MRSPCIGWLPAGVCVCVLRRWLWAAVLLSCCITAGRGRAAAARRGGPRG
eukprot:SAG25_NODE_5058_length_708_cov_9.229885_1_plen_49_part_01